MTAVGPGAAPEGRGCDVLSAFSLAKKAGLMGSANAAVPRLGLPAYGHWTEALHGLVAAAEPVTVYPANSRWPRALTPRRCRPTATRLPPRAAAPTPLLSNAARAA